MNRLVIGKTQQTGRFIVNIHNSGARASFRQTISLKKRTAEDRSKVSVRFRCQRGSTSQHKSDPTSQQSPYGLK